VSAAEFLGHGRGSKEASTQVLIRSARRGFPTHRGRNMMVLIGIDPHKATHTAVAVDNEETALAD